MSKLRLTSEEISFLEEIHNQENNKKTADKIKTLLFLNRGFTYEKTADLLMLDRGTIWTIVKKYKKDWLEKFLETNYVYYSWKLTDEQEKKVITFVENDYIWDSKEVMNFILKEFNVKYTVDGVIKLLNRLWFTYKKTKLVPAKANKEKQELHIQKYKELKENLKETEKILFMDGVHPMHNATNGYCWIKKGTEKEVKSNTGRNRININGAYCTETQEITMVTSDMKTRPEGSALGVHKVQ